MEEEKKGIKNTSDLTVGRPVGVLCRYAIPMLFSMFFQQAYNLVDGWIAGNYISTEAMAAVGACYPLTVFLIAISSGMSLGCSILCSQAFGRHDHAELKSGAGTALCAFIPLALLISALGLVLSPAVLRWLDVPEDLFALTVTYMRVYILAFPFQFIYDISNGVLTGMGNSRLPLLFLVLSSVCHIVLDLVFVALGNAGVSALAWATVLSQFIAAALALWTLRRFMARIPDRTPRFSAPLLKRILALGIPSMLQHMFMSLGQLAMQSIINGYGTVVLAGYSVVFRLNGIVINTLMALSNALSGFIAQNKGADKPERIRQGIRISLVLGYAFSALVIAVLFLCGERLIALFLSEETERAAVIAAGMGFIRVVVPFYLLVCLKIVCDGALRGLGAMTAFMLATLSDAVVRVFAGAPFSARWGITGVWAVWPVAWLFGTVLSALPLLFRLRELFRQTPAV